MAAGGVLESSENLKNTKQKQTKTKLMRDVLQTPSCLHGICWIHFAIKCVNQLHKYLLVFLLMLLEGGQNIILNRSSSCVVQKTESKLPNTSQGEITTVAFTVNCVCHGSDLSKAKKK